MKALIIRHMYDGSGKPVQSTPNFFEGTYEEFKREIKPTRATANGIQVLHSVTIIPDEE